MTDLDKLKENLDKFTKSLSILGGNASKSEVSGYSFDLKYYCSYCDDFKPVLIQEDMTTCEDNQRRVLNTIYCENYSMCAHIAEKFEKLGGIQ